MPSSGLYSYASTVGERSHPTGCAEFDVRITFGKVSSAKPCVVRVWWLSLLRPDGR